MSRTPCKVSELTGWRMHLAPQPKCQECKWPYTSLPNPTAEAKRHAALRGHLVEVVTETRATYRPKDWTDPEGPA